MQYSSGNESSAHEAAKTTNENGHSLESPPQNNRYSQSEESKDDEPLMKEFLLLNRNIPNVTIQSVRQLALLFPKIRMHIIYGRKFSGLVLHSVFSIESQFQNTGLDKLKKLLI